MHAVRLLQARLGYNSRVARRARWSEYPRRPPTCHAIQRTLVTGTPVAKGRSYATESEGLDLQREPDPVDSFLQGVTASYIDDMYITWKRNPHNVHASWQSYFRNMEDRLLPATKAFQPPPGLISSRQSATTTTVPLDATQSLGGSHSLKAQKLVEAFRQRGHTEARTNPLESPAGGETGRSAISANLEQFGFTHADLDAQIALGPDLLPQFIQGGNSTMRLRDIIAACEAVYCGSTGVEAQHVSDPEKREWLQTQIETPLKRPSPDEKKHILDNLIWATSLERFLAAKFPNEKRFGLDGAEGLAPAVATLIDRSVDVHGLEDIVIGSCHRGRMNMMSNVYGRNHESLFQQFAGTVEPDTENGHSGDVKYHYGMDGHRVTSSGNKVAISMLPNPSHLEAVNPVAQGKAKAHQTLANDTDQSKVMVLALHGDAAFSGQGPVYETINLANLRGYSVGGTIRLAVNNQVGFTTDPVNSRSTPYCTDLAKYIEAPVLHVNGDDPEALVHACTIAADWRARFKSDIMVDVVCYRRFGHNEIDQASFTQPEMYKQITAQESLLDKYTKKIVSEGVMTADIVEEQKQWVWQRLEEKLARSKTSEQPPNETVSLSEAEVSTVEISKTAVDEDILKKIASAITSTPNGFSLHRNLQRILAGQRADFDAGSVNWATAEALAFGSLLIEGSPVRITGQDVERGTFSQRHSVLHDQKTYEKHTPLNHLDPHQASYTAVNSPLSEFGVLGFDYGYSIAAKNALVMWEAQFGDFVNNAQVIVDQFISSGEAKWLLKSGIVLSLPHGYDGQGPEHSSARLGRFLELCNEATWEIGDALRQRENCNMQVVCMTTPANLFHVLRRQIRSPSKKPLVIFFSKSLLRHPLARSKVQDFTGSSEFKPVLTDAEHGHSIVDHQDIKRVIFCSGQVFAALHRYRETSGIKDVAITRIEELHPFPYAAVRDNIEQYPNAESIVWCQEEPYNGGAWHYIRDRMEALQVESKHHASTRLIYAGRKTGAAPATGSKKVHMMEENRLLEDAFYSG